MGSASKEGSCTREFLAGTQSRLNRKGRELKTNVTDPDSAKMATGKGVIQGYAAQATVDSSDQVIVAADVIGSGSEQAMLLPMIEQAATYCTASTVVTADAGYHSDANVQQLKDKNISALIADNQMRKRDERFIDQDKHKNKPDPLFDKKATGQPKSTKRFGPKDFHFNDQDAATCPADKTMLKPNDGRGRQVSRFLPKSKDDLNPSELMRKAIDSPEGRQLYSQRIGTVEPVFANLRHNKRLTRLSHRGKTKVNTQWNLYCMVHNIEKLANNGYARL